MEIFGFSITLSELFMVLGAFIGSVYAYHKIVSKQDALAEDVTRLIHDKERERKELVEQVNLVKNSLEARMIPMEAQIRAQEVSNSALNATLAAIQNQLSSVSGRLDTIITQILERK